MKKVFDYTYYTAHGIVGSVNNAAVACSRLFANKIDLIADLRIETFYYMTYRPGIRVFNAEMRTRCKKLCQLHAIINECTPLPWDKDSFKGTTLFFHVDLNNIGYHIKAIN